MPTCPQCDDDLEPAAAFCPACGVPALDERDAGIAEPAQRRLSAPSIAPVGAFSSTSEPPRRVDVVTGSAPRGGSARPLLQRHGAALAIEARAEPSAPVPVGRADTESRVIPIRRDPTPESVESHRPSGSAAPPAARASNPDAGANGATAEARVRAAARPTDPGGRMTPAPQPAARLSDGSRPTPSGQSAGRPPVLASEALRKDLAPAAPAGAGVRRTTIGLGALGAMVSLAVSGGAGLGLPLGGAFIAMAALGLVPLRYQARAAALVTLSGSGLAVVTWSQLERSTDLERLVLLVGVLLLSMSLLFRSWHRASLLARALVALGVSLCAGWLAISGALPNLLILEAGWQRWLPAVLPVPLVIALLLSLLAYMDSRSTGGCGAWAGLLLGWYTVYCWAELLPLYWPPHAGGLDLARVSADLAITALAGPLFAVVLAAGLAQLLSVATAAETS